MYSPNRNPTELYYERDALLRQEARTKRLLRRPLATLSTMLVVLVVFVDLASIVVGPSRAIGYVDTYLVHVVWILGLLVVVVGLLMLEDERSPTTERRPSTGSIGISGELPRMWKEGHVSLRRRGSIRL